MEESLEESFAAGFPEVLAAAAFPAAAGSFAEDLSDPHHLVVASLWAGSPGGPFAVAQLGDPSVAAAFPVSEKKT